MLAAARTLMLAVLSIGVLAAPPPGGSVAPGSFLVRQSGRAVPAEDPIQRIEIPGQNGVTFPRLKRGVQPRYTVEASRRQIQGDVLVECVLEVDGTVGTVRVALSLDPVYGLDAEALKAAKQWTFEPAARDGAPVRALVTLQMPFRLATLPAPAPLTWPAAFTPAAPGEGASIEWTTETLERDGLRATFARPKTWFVRIPAAGQADQLADGLRPVPVLDPLPRGTWFVVISRDGTRLVEVNRTASQPMPSRWNTEADLRRRQESSHETYRKAGSRAVLRGVGQAVAAGAFWVWTDRSAPAGDPMVPMKMRSRPLGTRGRVRIWQFMGRIDSHFVTLLFRVAYEEGSEQENARKEMEAAADFSAFFQSLTFESR